MKYASLLLLCIGCGHSDCVLPSAPVIESGTGTLTTEGNAAAMDAVSWTEASAPTITKSVSFSITFGSGPSVECNRIAWDSLANGAIVDVSQECIVIDGSTGATVNLTDATLSARSTLDAMNEGTVTLRFGVPYQRKVLVDDHFAFTHVDVAVDVLVVDIAFTHAQCGGGSWGFWDI